MTQEHQGPPQLESRRSSQGSDCGSSSCCSRGHGSTPRGSVDSACSTACGRGAGAWSPPLELEEPRVPKHEGALFDVSKRYQIHARHAGAGGFGQVFVADDREVQGRRVAIKKISLANAAMRQSFYRERQLLAQLDHPCICRMLETYETSDCGYLVVELCEGGDAFDRLSDRGVFSEAATAALLRQVTSALRYAHARGIAHRDVKPENICFTSHDAADARVKLIDWGAAFDFRAGRMRHAAGSTSYAAPEMYGLPAGGHYTEACDLWSLGVTAYVMLSGSPPFWGERDQQLMRMRAGKFPLVGGAWNKVSDTAKDFIRALLQPLPGDRPSAAAALEHPFLKAQQVELDVEAARAALENVRRFDAKSTSLALFAVQTARHLDQRSVRRLQQVFHGLDAEAAGELTRSALQQGVARVFGADSPEHRAAESHFEYLDLSGSGSISFTEFCAMALGGDFAIKDAALQAAILDFGADERCRQDVLLAADELSRQRDEAAKPCSSGLVAWLRLARGSRPLALLRPRLAEDDQNGKATFYGRLCCLVTGRRRRAGREELLPERRDSLDKTLLGMANMIP